MGSCICSGDRKSTADAKRQLDSLFHLSNKDFLRVGTQEDLAKYYDILEQDCQSHENCTTGLITDKASGEQRFCKTIRKSESMSMKQIEKCC